MMQKVEAFAKRWLNNLKIETDWCEKKGVTLEWLRLEQSLHARHEPSAVEVYKNDDYVMSVCPFEKGFRYTVVCPWGQTEGLGDAPIRVDAVMITFLDAIIGEVERLTNGNVRRVHETFGDGRYQQDDRQERQVQGTSIDRTR